jgi:hypothetical protein
MSNAGAAWNQSSLRAAPRASDLPALMVNAPKNAVSSAQEDACVVARWLAVAMGLGAQIAKTGQARDE